MGKRVREKMRRSPGKRNMKSRGYFLRNSFAQAGPATGGGIVELAKKGRERSLGLLSFIEVIF